MPDTPTREIFWQISHPWVFYAVCLAALAVFLLGVLRSIRFIRQGAASSIRPIRVLGVRATVREVLSHASLAGEDKARWWHLLVSYGFVLLFLVTCYLMLAHYWVEGLFTGVPYLFVTLAADLAGAGVVLGVVFALITVRKDTSPVRDRSRAKRTALCLLGAVCITGFLVEGARIHIQGDPWRIWSPVGTASSWLFAAIPLAESKGPALYKALWWLHAVLALGLIAWIPVSARMRHMLFLPFHRAATPLEPRSPAPLVDFGSLRASRPSPGSVRLGIETASDLTRKQRLGLLACMDCGRCERLCPAFQSGQTLTPRKYLQDLRAYALDSGREGEGPPGGGPSSACESVTPSSLWACRLCRACEELCPAGIEHVPQMIEIRRAEVLGHGRLPGEGAAALRNLARTGNPYGAGPSEREAWILERRIPREPPGDPEKALVLWTGCFQPGDEQKPRVLSCLVELLRILEVPFFIPQGSTACCGDPARILGEEDLFQALAGEQIRRFEASGAREVLVHCPHGYTVLKDVYPLLGARFSVLHTSEFFSDPIRAKKLHGRGFPCTLSVMYHDPCFLSRYREMAEAPRGILRSIPGVELVEPSRSGRQSYCCGAGGGHFFMDLDLEERPSSQRLGEILEQAPQVLAVSCGFCFSMFDDAARRLAAPSSLRIADWLEVLREAQQAGEAGGR